MKKLLLLIILTISSLVTFAQENYWTENFKVISSITFSDFKMTLEKKLDYSDYRANPDGWKFYRTTLAIGIIRGGEKKMTTIETDIYTSARYTTAMIPCMLANPNNNSIYIFSNAKASDRMYGMDGYTYTIDLNSNNWQKETVFQSANWGWYSFFGGSDNGNPQLNHFAYAGYFAMKSTRNRNNNWQNRNIGSISPDEADKQYYLHNNILWTNSANVDEYKLNKSENYYSNYQPNSYNNVGSDITFSDLIGTFKTIKNLWDFGTKVIPTIINSSYSDILNRITNCASQTHFSAISDNAFIASTISESINSVMKKNNLTLSSIGSTAFDNLVIQDLQQKGHNDLATLMTNSIILKCLTE
jgi:hypothetical protein